MKRRSFLLVVLALIAGTAISAPVGLIAETYKAVTLSYPPLVISADLSHADSGLCLEIVQEAARRAGVSLSIQVMPWARAFETAKTNRDILIFPLIKNDERDKIFDWIGPVTKSQYTVFRLKKSIAPKISKLSEIGSYAVGVISSAAEDAYLQLRTTLKRDGSAHIEMLVNKFLNGRTQYIIVEAIALDFELNRIGYDRSGLDPLFIIDTIIPDGFSYLAVAKGSQPKIASNLRAAISEMRADGTWQSIFIKWHKKQSTVTAPKNQDAPVGEVSQR